MSAEAILRAIATESAEEVGRIHAAARAQAAALIEAARTDASRRVAEALAAAEPELRADAARRVNAARLQLLHARAEGRARRVSTVFDEAAHRLDRIAAGDGRRWEEALARLADEACAGAGPDARVTVERASGTVTATSADGSLIVDASPAKRLARARTLLVDEVAEMLEGA